MAQQLAIHANAGFPHQLTGNKSWMACDYTPSRIWAMARSDVDPIARLINHPRKTLMTVFFGVNGIALINILLEKTKLSSEYFWKNLTKEFDLIVYSAGRKPHATRICLHFDNAPIHGMRTVVQTMVECDFRRFDHSADSPCLAPYDFFLFDYLHEKKYESLSETVQELKEKI
jgi:hypothetical protein